jgi:PDZ domain-containing protein
VSRRVRTLVVGGVLFVGLFALAVTMPVPYVMLSPGPTYNTLGTDDNGDTIIVIHDTSAPKPTDGHLNMTTVGVSTQSLTAFGALVGWLQHDRVVVPRSAVYPPGQSQQQTDAQNTADFAESQDDAIAAASCELGYPAKFGVLSVEANTPAMGNLHPGDVLDSINGKATTTASTLTSALAKLSPGTTVKLAITRAAMPVTMSITLATPPTSVRTSGGFLGVEVGSVCATPFTVDLGLGNQIGGPSAGLMFALGIMDKVGPVDLTDGRFIAGTGTIDTTGKVGPIGGIQLKMIAARRAGATVFLAPAGNCSDVRGAIPKGLKVIKVDTLHDAVTDLETLEAGGTVAQC